MVPLPSAPNPQSPKVQPKTRRLTIAISVAAMAALKVIEGQILQTGDTIVDLCFDYANIANIAFKPA